VLPSSITVSTVQVIKKLDELVLGFLSPCRTVLKPLQAKRHLKLDTTPLAQHRAAAILTFSAGYWVNSCSREPGVEISGLALAILRTNSRISLPVPGRPAPQCFERWVQYNANPFRCHRTTVSGLTTIRDSRHLCQTEERQARKSRSLRCNRTMGALAFQDCQLLPQRQIFERQLSLIFKPRF
jgi:hypothetical protein